MFRHFRTPMKRKAFRKKREECDTKMKKLRIASLFLAIALVVSLFAGCDSGNNSSKPGGDTLSSSKTESTPVSSKTESTPSGEKVTLHYTTYCVGTHLAAPEEAAWMARFREQYGDSIELVVEELPTDTVYTDKMKTLAAAGELPDMVDGKNGLRDLAIKNGQAVELSAMLDADPNFRDNVIGKDAIAANTDENGNIYSIAWTAQAIGYFYNKDLFAQAGIKPAETWDEFWSNCDKLVEAGITPLSLMTGENSWTTNLLLAAMVASKSEAGEKLMNTKFPETYQTPEMIEALEEMQIALQKYTTPDALGAAYANTANYFLQEQTAMICNGSWMIGDFSNEEKAVPGLADHIGFAVYPGNGMVQTYPEGMVICAKTPETQEAAFKLLKEACGSARQKDSMEFRGGVPISSEVEITDEFMDENPLFAENVGAQQTVEYKAATFDVMAYASVVDAFGIYYPELAAGTLDAAGMAAKLDEAAAKAG